MKKEVLKNYIKEIKELIKLKHDIVIPSIFIDIHLEIAFLERYCILNSLERNFEIIFLKYKTRLIKEFDKEIQEVLRGLKNE